MTDHPDVRRRARLPFSIVLTALAIVLIVSMLAGLALGSISIPPLSALKILVHQLFPNFAQPDGPPYYQTVISQVRGPRVLLGAVVGAGLSVVGMALQALLRNPLADPFLLGVSSGASVGAVAVIITGVSFLGLLSTSAAAFIGSLAALALVYSLSRAGGLITPTRLVLAGVAVAYLLSAVTSLMLITARTGDQARQILTWMLGSLGTARWDTLWLPAVTVSLGLIVLIAQSRTLNVLLAGDDTAATMGVDVNKFRIQMFVLTSLIAGVLVAVSGPIGFVGLILPHAVRILVGSDHRRGLPAAALSGAAFLVLCDVASRTLAAPQEVPVGVVTALCGGPFFLWLIRRESSRGISRQR